MNDRYLFRGKRKDTGAWMIGSLVCFPDDNEHYGIWSENAQSYLWVDSATVGQCTGLKDKNGTLIFEGDLLKGEYPEISYGENGKPFEGEMAVFIESVQFYTDQGGYMFCSDVGELSVFDEALAEKTEIIGNIHDTNNGGKQCKK